MLSQESIPSLRPQNVEKDLVRTACADDSGLLDRYSPDVHGNADFKCSTSVDFQLVRQIRRKHAEVEEGIVGMLCAATVRHQIGIAVNLLVLLALAHMCFPRARRHTRKFVELNYYDPATSRYGQGWDDLLMVFHWIVVFTGLRAACMEYLLTPMARKVGISTKKNQVRFAEQAWVFVYFSAFWSLGMYIMYTSDYWLSLENVWKNWPDRQTDGLMKWYYLIQFAFWLQQILVVNIEKRRKDHVQMFTHHIITCILMLTSYGYHHTRVGNVILCLMDFVDIILPLAKMLKYLEYRVACDVGFGVFIVGWFILRHVLYLVVCCSLYTDLPRLIKYGCYFGPHDNLQGPIEVPNVFTHLTIPFRDPQGLVCQTPTTTGFFLAMLLFLQMILCLWFGMILRLAWKVILGQGADDPRSDDEEEVEEELEAQKPSKSRTEKYIELPPLEEEVGVDATHLNGRKNFPVKKYRKGGIASSVSLHHDRRELLGRIGCDKTA